MFGISSFLSVIATQMLSRSWNSIIKVVEFPLWLVYASTYLGMNQLFGLLTNYKLPAYEIWYWFEAAASYLFGTLFRHFVILSCFLIGAGASPFSLCSPCILWKCLKYLWVVRSMSALCTDDVWNVREIKREREEGSHERIQECHERVSADTKWYIVYAFYPSRVL